MAIAGRTDNHPRTPMPPSNQCQGAICRANVCTIENRPDFTRCNDSNACTTEDHCEAGVCVGTPVVCDDPPVCRTATGAICNGGTGECTYPALADGTSCGTQSVPGGGAIHCCEGACPDPDCVPADQPCAARVAGVCCLGCIPHDGPDVPAGPVVLMVGIALVARRSGGRGGPRKGR